MITLKDVQEAQKDIAQSWGEEIVMECMKYESLQMSANEFLDKCTACGGNWGGMLLSGVKVLRPVIWEMIPENMGHNAWLHICNLLVLLGIDISEQ